jgi:hypothetical protein
MTLNQTSHGNSCMDTECYQLLLAHDLGFLSQDTHHVLNEQVAEVRRMLCRFLHSLGADT